MQTMLDSPLLVASTIDGKNALCAAQQYVAQTIDPSFEVVPDSQAARWVAERGVWRAFVRCQAAPLCAIEVDAHSGKVIPLSQAEIRLVREKAAVFTARKADVLPLNDRGYVLGEYARRRASRYLDDHISMYFSGENPVLVESPSPVWQVAITFKRYSLGPFTPSVMNVDARTGEPIPLSNEQLEQIREQTRAFIRHQTPPTDAG